MTLMTLRESPRFWGTYPKKNPTYVIVDELDLNNIDF